ncbi:MAG TPA: aldo/keto reductase [Tissierellia bacterium]|nr:aldo/keto reductase [Tissierellia bacterium]
MKPSRLCFGSLTVSPLQCDFSAGQAAELFCYALQKGINFFDTAELYRNYDHFKLFFEQIRREEVVFASKCYAYDKESAKRSLDLALTGANIDYLDFFMLHEQESEHTLRGHAEAIDFFLDMKAQGLLRRFGISTHFVAGALAAAEDDRIEVVHPIINRQGIGIADGTREDMEQALRKLRQAGKFIYAMKALGGGHLLKEYPQALSYALALDVDAIAIGMQSAAEIDHNLAAFSGQTDLEPVPKSRHLNIDEWCIGCGNCAARCQQQAIQVIDGRAVVDDSRCVLCSYCVETCPDFCIKVI